MNNKAEKSSKVFMWNAMVYTFVSIVLIIFSIYNGLNFKKTHPLQSHDDQKFLNLMNKLEPGCETCKVLQPFSMRMNELYLKTKAENEKMLIVFSLLLGSVLLLSAFFLYKSSCIINNLSNKITELENTD